MIKGNCSICGVQITPASDQVQFNRNVGLHKRVAHGIKGMNPSERYYVYQKGMTLEQAREHINSKAGKPVTPEIASKLTAQQQRRKEYQKWYRSQHKAKQAAATNGTMSSEAVSARLSECPCCGARFFMVKGAA